MKSTEEIKAKFLADLRGSLNPGDTLHCIVRNVAASGMSRSIDVYSFCCVNGRIQKEWLSWRVAAVLGASWDNKRECIKVTGCGMDMIYATVYDLGRVLWPEGFGVRCREGIWSGAIPTTKEIAAEAVAAGAIFRGRNGDASGWDNDGGYALRAEQI